MRSLALVLLSLIALADSALDLKYQYDLADAEKLFEEFSMTYRRQYSSSYDRQSRLENFKKNLENYNRLNKLQPTAVFGINQFADLTTEEFKAKYSCINLNGSAPFGGSCSQIYRVDTIGAPENHDWRNHNAVSRVKEQRNCGSCWAFSASGAVEGAHAIKHGRLIELSEQQLVDCDQGSNGCDGGLMSSAMETLIQQGGAMSENSYPYEEVKSQCRFDPNSVEVKLTGCKQYNIQDEEQLKEIVYRVGPVAIGLDSKLFIGYSGGILRDCPSNGTPDHAVLLVGYGTEGGEDYWIIKNSWGTSFGEAGYIKIKRGENACNLMNALMATPEVA